MTRKILSLSAVSLILSACGGGGGGGSESTSGPAVYTGTFIDSAVAGLHYETPSRSGLTNANGEFSYLADELVTFSLGGTTLGIVSGDGSAEFEVTPFSLFGIDPVTSETEITSTLGNASVGSFERALNVAMLLQTFDMDGDPDNGIDLGDANQTLSSDTIDLFTKSVDFLELASIRDAKRKADISHTRDMLSAVKHLYSSLEVDIESAQVSNFESVIGLNNTQSSDYDYDDNGNVLTERTDSTGDGNINIIKQYQYDEHGNVTSLINSASETAETMEYDGNNNLISRLTEINLGQSTLERYNYNLSNTVQRFELDIGNNGSIDSTTRYQYDGTGNLIEYQIDRDGDTVADSIARYVYDDDGHVATYTEDRDNNDIPDLVIAYAYDAQGNRQSYNIDISSEGYPSAPGNFIYDSNNNVTRYEIDRDLDGNPDYIEAYTYNGNNQRTSFNRDLDGNGTWDKISQYFYDENGHRTQMAEDTDGNGIADKVWSGNYQPAIVENAWDKILSES